MSDDEFYKGICSALAVVTLFDMETIFDEIVGTVDAVALVKFARKTGSMRWSGLTKYHYGDGGKKR